jgi:hypothetical protein
MGENDGLYKEVVLSFSLGDQHGSVVVEVDQRFVTDCFHSFATFLTEGAFADGKRLTSILYRNAVFTLKRSRA